MKVKFVFFVFLFVTVPIFLQAQKVTPTHYLKKTLSSKNLHSNASVPLKFTELEEKLGIVREIVGKNSRGVERSPASIGENYSKWPKSKIRIRLANPKLRLRYVQKAFKNQPDQYMDVSSETLEISYGIYIFWTEMYGEKLEEQVIPIHLIEHSISFLKG